MSNDIIKEELIAAREEYVKAVTKLFGIANKSIRAKAHAQLHHARINGELNNR